MHLLSFGRTDMNHTLAATCEQEAGSRQLGLLRQEAWEGLRVAEGQWSVASTSGAEDRGQTSAWQVASTLELPDDCGQWKPRQQCRL